MLTQTHLRCHPNIQRAGTGKLVSDSGVGKLVPLFVSASWHGPGVQNGHYHSRMWRNRMGTGTTLLAQGHLQQLDEK
jgi:hypothetical protein